MNVAEHCQLRISHRRLSSLLVLLSITFMIPVYAHAQSGPITSSELNTRVSAPSVLPSGQTQYNITGGTRPGGGGTNLFHSFGDFNVPTNNIANFLNDAGLPTSNILGRVTAGNPSVIYGLIQTNGPGGFGNANLFLMNPAGFLFGPNATLNVGGMVAFTTADYLRFQGTNTLFNNASTPESLSPLSMAPVAAFGFLGNNPAAIAIQGSTLQVADGQSLSLVGGNQGFTATDPDTGNPIQAPNGITMTGGKLFAPGGQINIASVAGPGEISAIDFTQSPGMAMGNISLSQVALVDVSADAAGIVRIRAGQLTMDNATVSADTLDANGAPTAIDVQVSEDLLINSERAPAFTARTFGAGNAGDITIASKRLTATSHSDGSSTFFSFIESSTFGRGNGGNIHLATGKLDVSTDPLSVPTFFIDSGTAGEGNGGNVAIEATDAHFSNTGMNTGDTFFGGIGSAGGISIKADTLTIEGSTFTADSLNARGGDMLLVSREIIVSKNSFLDVLSLEGESAVRITTDRLVVDDASSILNQTALGSGGGINISAKTVELTNSSLVLSQTFGDGDAGNIHVTAADHITVADDPELGSNPSGFYTNSFGNAGLGTLGKAGAIEIITPKLTLSGGARINSTTQTSGGGEVSITAQEITLSGQRTLEVDSEFFGLGGTKATGIYTRTVGSEFCIPSCGDAGNVTISTGSLTLQNGGVIDSGTTNSGKGGTLTVTTAGQLTLSGTMLDGTPTGIFSRTIGTTPDAGSGGNIALTAGQSVSISDGASVSASSTGPGNAGNIAINAGQQFEMRNSSVKTEAAQASGGNIDIQAIDRIRLVNSSISTSVLGGAGSGGNITIDPNVVILQNSQIMAQAVQGAGGNISIVTPLFLADAGSLVDASSQFGLNGTVNIQSPTSNLAGTISSLPSSLRQAQSLQTGRCAALADSRSSSLIIAGRDILPAEPGGWSPSPFALMGEETDSLAIASPPVATMIASADAPVSLRRLTPAGFLIQSFAESGLTGCRS